MQDLNSVILIGRITRDVGSDERSFGYIGNGTAKAVISIAVNSARKQGDQWVDEASFFNVTLFGKSAESLKPYLTKGTQIAVMGRLKQDSWEKDGQKHSAVSIIADNIQLLGSKKDSEKEPVMRPKAQVQSQTIVNPDDGFPEDVPF